MRRTTVLSLLLMLGGFFFSPQLRGQSLGDTISIGGPGNCGSNVSATFVVGAAAGAGTGLQAVGTAFTAVYQAASSGAATDIISCGFPGMSRTTTGKGMNAVAGIAFFYGPVTTAPTSENAPTCVSLSMPVPAAGETASVAAGTAITLVSVPVIASFNATAVTTGQFYTEYLSFTTPPGLNSLYGTISCSFSFAQSAASAMQINTPGFIVFTTNTITWLKHHSHDKSVVAMQRLGISHETAELIFATYRPKNRQAIEYMAAYNERHRPGEPVVAKLGENLTLGPSY